MKLEAYQCGTKVSPIGLPKDVDAMVIGIIFRFGQLLYDVGYFYQGEYKVCVLNEKEFNVEYSAKKTEIGYK